MPDGQNQGPDVAGKAPAREPVVESLDADPTAPGGGDDVAGFFALDAGFPIAGDSSACGAGPGQAMPIVGEPWP